MRRTPQEVRRLQGQRVALRDLAKLPKIQTKVIAPAAALVTEDLPKLLQRAAEETALQTQEAVK